MVISISFHKDLPCGVVISGGREDDNEPKKPTDCFHFPASFFSFLIVFSFLGEKLEVYMYKKFLTYKLLEARVPNNDANLLNRCHAQFKQIIFIITGLH